MSQIIFIGPGFFVDVLGMSAPDVAEVVLDLNGLKLEGQIEFIITVESGKPETRAITPVLSINKIPGPRLPVYMLSDKVSEILQNYKYFSEVMARVWDAGFLKYEPN